MTNDYIKYESSHSPSRSTRPSVQVKKVTHHDPQGLRYTDSTQPSGKSIVYTHKKTSYSHTRYVHKSNQKPIQAV